MHQLSQRASDVNVNASEAKRSQAKRSEAKPSQAKPSQAKPSQAKPSAAQRQGNTALSIVNGKLLSRSVQWKNVETSPYQQVAVVNIIAK